MATSKYKKSAKDLAFEREKTKLQARNLQLCRELAEAQKELEPRRRNSRKLVSAMRNSSPISRKPQVVALKLSKRILRTAK